ncbi:hypothetical protein D3C86_1913630 [compost metagenome]
MVHHCDLGVALPEENSNKIKVYPNPSTGIFQLSKELEWTVFSALGAKIKQGSGNLIDISEHASGVYFLKTNEANKAIHIIKL